MTVTRGSTARILRSDAVINVLVPFASPSITGNVYNDTNGSVNIDGTATNAGGTFVNVIDNNNLLVYSATVNSATGQFTVPIGYVLEDSTYRFELSKNTGTIGIAAPLKELPVNWITVGESKTGISPFANDGLNDGTIAYTIGNTNVTDLRFGVVSAFGCNNTMYLSQSNTLYTINTSTNPFTYPAVGSAASFTYNAIAINPVDGKMYGIRESNKNLIVINPDGTTTDLGAVTGLPTGTVFAGEIDNTGKYYVKINSNNNQLYRVDLTTRVATLITLSASNTIPDLGYSITTGLLYGVNSVNGQLVSINPNTGVVTGIGTAPGVAANFGAMFTSSTGEVFGVNNAGGFYQFNLTTGGRVLISGAPASSGNDGAHCVTVPITFSADLSISKTDSSLTYTPGSTTTYLVTVTNNGPFGVLNAVVTDSVPAGIPASNVSYTAVASAGSTTNVTGTQTGALNDLAGLPVGGSVTYAINVAVPYGFEGNLINTASVTPPSNISDVNTSNNTATDTDTSTACYRPGISGTGLPTNYGISALGRAGTENGNWPMVRQGAWTALESKTKGFVLNRIPTTTAVEAIPNPVEGMMVYDEQADCLKIYSVKSGVFGWYCFSKPSCGEVDCMVDPLQPECQGPSGKGNIKLNLKEKK